MQIQISWLLKKPTDLDLHCLQNRVYPGSAGQGLKKKSIEDIMRSVVNDAYSILFSVFFIEAYVVGTRLNCLDLSRQFKQVPTTYVFIKKYK